MSQTATPERAVPVHAEAGTRRRVMGATDWWFYPLMLIAAVGLIAASLGGDVYDQPAVPQHASARNGAALVYGPHELARGARVDATHVRFIVRDYGVSARAVRFAVRKNGPPPGPDAKGVTLLLDPAETAALAGKPVRVVLSVRRFAVTAAGGISVSLENGATPVTWVTVPLPTENGDVTVDLPPLAGPAPTGLGMRMLTDQQDFNRGAEIAKVTLQPIG